MKKIIIGIIPIIKNDNNPYLNTYTFVKKYSEVLYKFNAIPLGILPDDDTLKEDVLDLCDGFIFPGGSAINPNLFAIFSYAIFHHKPVLGICLGMQAMGIFSLILDVMQKIHLPLNDNFAKIKEIYASLKKQDNLLPSVTNLDEHFNFIPDFQNAQNHTHQIKILPNTMLYEVYGTSQVSVTSLHRHYLKEVGKSFIVSAMSRDGTTEAIENKDYHFLGVQYHPEALEDAQLFNYFIKLCEKVRKEE